MDESHEKQNPIVRAQGNTSISINKSQFSTTDCSVTQQTIVENGIDETKHPHKTSVAQQLSTSDKKCTVNQLGDSFSKSEETPTNDISILSRYPEESKSAPNNENCVMNVGDKDVYDIHSDSVETLEENYSNKDGEELSDSLVQPIKLTNDQRSCDILSETVVDIAYSETIADTTSFSKCDLRAEDIPHYEVPGIDSTFDDDVSSVINGAMRPFSLSLAKTFQSHDRNRSKSDDEVRYKDKRSVLGKERTQSDTIDIQTSRRQLDHFDSEDYVSRSLPKGTIMRKGDLIEFVASDLEEKIRHSSPISLTGSSVSSRKSSLRSIHSISSSTSTSMATSTASGMSRSPSSLYQQSPDDIPVIDPQAIIDLENQARLVADSIDLMMGNLRGSLHKMSAISVGCVDAYQRSVDITCDSVDSSIKSMYALMAKCEELCYNMKPVYQLAHQIKEIKRLLDLFEAQLSDK